MRGGELVHIVDLTVRSLAPVEWRAIPGRLALFERHSRSRSRYHRRSIALCGLRRRLRARLHRRRRLAIGSRLTPSTPNQKNRRQENCRQSWKSPAASHRLRVSIEPYGEVQRGEVQCGGVQCGGVRRGEVRRGEVRRIDCAPANVPVAAPAAAALHKRSTLMAWDLPEAAEFAATCAPRVSRQTHRASQKHRAERLRCGARFPELFLRQRSGEVVPSLHRSGGQSLQICPYVKALFL